MCVCVFGETLNTNQKVSFPNISGLLPIKRAHSKHIKQGITGLETPIIGIKPAGMRQRMVWWKIKYSTLMNKLPIKDICGKLGLC